MMLLAHILHHLTTFIKRERSYTLILSPQQVVLSTTRIGLYQTSLIKEHTQGKAPGTPSNKQIYHMQNTFINMYIHLATVGLLPLRGVAAMTPLHILWLQCPSIPSHMYPMQR
jgi:hypothetical protein